MDTFVVIRTYFTGSGEYSSVVGVCATEEIAKELARVTLKEQTHISMCCDVVKYKLMEG